jgi:hypothetical protein
MDELAREYAGRAHALFVYAREAHPDDFPDYPAHNSQAQKVRHAAELQRRWNTPRTILVDNLDGDVHRAWGGLPNMSWIIDHTGRIAFKAAWTRAGDIRAALETVSRARDEKRAQTSPTPYYKEAIDYSWSPGRRAPERQSLERVGSAGAMPSAHRPTHEQ